MKPRFLLSVVLLSLAGIGLSQYKVISFNIRLELTSDGDNQWDLRKSSTIDFLNYESPDFIGMQEVLNSQLEDLENGLNKYKWIGVARDDGKNAGEFSPIFYDRSQWNLMETSTFWLSQTPDIPSKSWDAALPRICTWGKFENVDSGNAIFVFNSHFDHIGKEARFKSAKLIVDQVKKIAGDNKMILLGDFNAEPESPPIKAILKSQLEDAFSKAEIKFGSVGTFNGFDHQKIPDRRIDYVFTSQDLNIVSYAVASHLIEGRYLSDHFPIIVTFNLK